MNSLVFVLLTIASTSDITATTENRKIIRSSSGIATVTNYADKATQEQVSWTNLHAKQNSFKTDDSGAATNTKANSSTRKSKLLQSLAFITGLGVHSLAEAASTNVKTYAKFPLLGLNVGASRISPQIAAVYDPYPYMSHSYIFATPLGFYQLWDPLRLQSINREQNNYQILPQNLQPSNSLDNNKSTDLLNSDDEYVDEAKKIENVNPASNVDENNKKSTKLQEENERNAEEKVSSLDTTCKAQNKINSKESSSLKSISKEREDADGSLTASNLRAASTTASPNTTLKNTTQAAGTGPKNETNSTGTMTSTQNSTTDSNTNSPLYGYYGGYPQNINHIQLTTEAYDHKYNDYEHNSYNLPSFNKPLNFYSDDNYNYYAIPPVDSYPTSQFQQDQIPEYFSNDYKRFIYTPDNTPTFANNDFRPVV